MNVPPDPPWPHKLLRHHVVFRLHRLVGRPTICIKYGGVESTLSAGPGNVVQLVTTQRKKLK